MHVLNSRICKCNKSVKNCARHLILVSKRLVEYPIQSLFQCGLVDISDGDLLMQRELILDLVLPSAQGHFVHVYIY